MIIEILKKFKDYQADFCVTILIQTHRTHPENKQDEINLKNGIKEAKERLLAEYEQRDVEKAFENLDQLQESIDHNFNLDSLVIFVNNEICEYVRLPIPVDPRQIIDTTFATRDLVRSLHQSVHYYILTLSEKEAHLYTAFRDRIGSEIESHGFPFTNTLYTTDPIKLAASVTEENYAKEFFNRVDKAFLDIHQENPAKVIIATVEENFYRYRDIADEKELIIGQVKGNWDDQNKHNLAKESWKVLEAYLAKEKEMANQIIGQAESQNKLVSGIEEIFDLVNQGRGDTLIVEDNFFQAAVIQENNQIELIEDSTTPGAVDDIIDEIIEQQLRMKGKVIFLDEGSLEQYQKMALSLRY